MNIASHLLSGITCFRAPLFGILLLVFTVLAAGCGGSESGDGTRDSRPTTAGDETPQAVNAVEAFLTTYYDALSDRDWEQFSDLFHDGAHIAFVMPDSTGVVRGVTFQSVPEFVSLAPLGPGSREIFEERMTTHSIHVAGDLAVGWIGYEARFGDPGDIMEWTGTDAITMIRIRDRWRITSLAYVPEL